MLSLIPLAMPVVFQVPDKSIRGVVADPVTLYEAVRAEVFAGAVIVWPTEKELLSEVNAN
jgi:hypothetical protein